MTRISNMLSSSNWFLCLFQGKYWICDLDMRHPANHTKLLLEKSQFWIQQGTDCAWKWKGFLYSLKTCLRCCTLLLWYTLACYKHVQEKKIFQIGIEYDRATWSIYAPDALGAKANSKAAKARQIPVLDGLCTSTLKHPAGRSYGEHISIICPQWVWRITCLKTSAIASKGDWFMQNTWIHIKLWSYMKSCNR